MTSKQQEERHDQTVEDETDGSRFPDLRANLIRHLSICGDEDFMLLVFAVNALQKGQVKVAELVLTAGYPQELVNAKLPDRQKLHEWELETLVNEFLTASTTYRYLYSGHPRLRHKSVPALAYIVSLLRDLENEEYAYLGHDIYYELRRTINRQFEWQRGFFNKALAYRTAVMYGGPECDKHLKSTLGVTLDEMSFGAFTLLCAFQNFAQVDRSVATSHIGLPHHVRDIVFDLFSSGFTEARQFARAERRLYRTTAYRPSVLRRSPCLRRSDDEQILICPLPQLIMARATTGVFYDVINGGGVVRNEFGRNFEKYCVRLLTRCYPSVRIEPEFSYRFAHKIDSPDILVSDDGGLIKHVYECKAVRMPFADRFAEAEFAGRGYDEVAKAVFQIWRFASHCRRGLTGREISPDAVGVVILLDSWMRIS